MAKGENERQEYGGTENPFRRNFILPSKTNHAVKIVAPPVKTGKPSPSPASQDNDSSSSHNGSHDSSRLASSSIAPGNMGESKPLDESFSDITVQTGSEGSPTHVALSLPATDSSLDIYAGNYIPMWQKAINEVLATPRFCCPLSTIDYATYINSFAGHRVLSVVPPIELPPIHTVPLRLTCEPEQILPEQYGDYLSDALQNEITAQFEELMSCSMYNVPFVIDDASQHLYRFNIPGLREHSPRVDLGDVVKIRPLVPPPPPQVIYAGQQTVAPLTPGFSGVEFQAIVWGISKQQEQVVLRMDDFVPNLLRACNIIFAVQEHHCAPLWRSVNLTWRPLSGVNKRSSLWLRRMLFPDKQDAKIQSTLSRGDFNLKWFDPQMNFEQQKAVDAVVTADYGCVPYLISGPPGTGKTKTIVETALQLLQSGSLGPTPHLLVCAPSDPAADTLTTRLSAHLDPSSLFRLNGWTRSFAEVPSNLLPYTNTENDLFSIPDFETMMSYKVVVTTCRDAEMLFQARLTNEALRTLVTKSLSAIAPKLAESVHPNQLIHWTALLLDEAAQAIEPEALIPLSVVDPGSSVVSSRKISMGANHHVPQVIMAGDEYQLGPRLFLKSASPLSTSLFARLFRRQLYHAHPLSRANGCKRLTSAMLPMLRPTFTNLVRNYRAHPAILTVPSVLFYADTLVAECTTLSEAVRTWPGWKRASSVFGCRIAAAANRAAAGPRCPKNRPDNPLFWPVLFIENASADALESILAGNGTGAGGLFNAGEAEIALNVVRSLLSHSIPMPKTERVPPGLSELRLSIHAKEIVVMSPFEAQVNYLRKRFREAGLYDVNIGPLEAFQGLESRIVVLCTTRTKLGTGKHRRDRFVREDQASGFGVIGEPKRFNVAITRAMEGLIVVGRAECLTCTADEAWIEFLAFCQRTSGLDASNSKTSPRPPVSCMQREGRLEGALRYAENLRTKRSEAGGGDDDVSEGQQTGFGYSTRSKPSRNRLKGNMPSLDEEMFREGLKLADEIRENDDANDVVHPAEHLTGVNECGEQSRRQPSPRMMPPGKYDPFTPHPPRHSSLTDIANTPRRIDRGSSGVATEPAIRGSWDGLVGKSFGSLRKAQRSSTGKSNVPDIDSPSRGEKKTDEDFENDAVAKREYESSDWESQ